MSGRRRKDQNKNPGGCREPALRRRRQAGLFPVCHVMNDNPDKSNGVDCAGGPGVADYAFPGERIGHMRVASRPDCLRLVRALVQDTGGAIGCSVDCIADMVMAVDEACQNIIRHAYGGDPGGEIVVDIRRGAASIGAWRCEKGGPRVGPPHRSSAAHLVEGGSAIFAQPASTIRMPMPSAL